MQGKHPKVMCFAREMLSNWAWPTLAAVAHCTLLPHGRVWADTQLALWMKLIFRPGHLEPIFIVSNLCLSCTLASNSGAFLEDSPGYWLCDFACNEKSLESLRVYVLLPGWLSHLCSDQQQGWLILQRPWGIRLTLSSVRLYWTFFLPLSHVTFFLTVFFLWGTLA